jgi:hypothetical protein
LKTTDEKFPVDAIREAGYETVWHGQKAWNGVAILDRGEEPEETRRGLPGDPDDIHSRYVDCAGAGGPVVPPPRRAVFRSPQALELAEAALEQDGTRGAPVPSAPGP